MKFVQTCRFVRPSLVALAALGASGSAFAVDVTAVTAEMTAGKASVIEIGAAVLLILVAIAVFKYVRKAF